MAQEEATTALGPNAWLVDEMYEQYVADPSSVGESWREFFEDYKPEPEPEPKANGEKAEEKKQPEKKKEPPPVRPR